MSWSQKYFCVRFGVYYKGKPTHTRNSLYTTRENLPILERVYNLISTYCRENVCFDKRIKYQRVFVYIKMVLIY